MEEQKVNQVQVSNEELRHYVEKSVRDLRNVLNEARHKPYFKRSNPYDNLLDNFGDDPAKLIMEFERIQDKKSSLPSGQREAIKEIVQRAMQMAVRDKLRPYMPKPEPKNGNVEVITPDRIANLPEGTRLHIAMPEVHVPPILPSPYAKKERRKKK